MELTLPQQWQGMLLRIYFYGLGNKNARGQVFLLRKLQHKLLLLVGTKLEHVICQMSCSSLIECARWECTKDGALTATFSLSDSVTSAVAGSGSSLPCVNGGAFMDQEPSSSLRNPKRRNLACNKVPIRGFCTVDRPTIVERATDSDMIETSTEKAVVAGSF
ncbi:hypothetical protein D8674_023268 [Pyrus ussuriensis x Pyrus communis]|uniref:Uncharacterized protein n=1 Tax=Pyrus ussuriensis x Pyrus communis TaxID=2448454 RepID=A0A5N5GU24_9ROSA|nr:hypothetical protein D8674_023268 [Pyrus ussuriensis x Pyrus communis]